MEQQQKPTIRVIHIPSNTADTTADRTVIEINRGQFVIEVQGFGSADGRFKITGRDAGKLMESLIENNMPAPGDDDRFKIADYGLALVYVEPTTFAHVILDMYQNT